MGRKFLHVEDALKLKLHTEARILVLPPVDPHSQKGYSLSILGLKADAP